MKLLIISASQRHPSQSAKVAEYINSQVNSFASSEHIALCQLNLPFWDGEEESRQSSQHDWQVISDKIDHADAFILITPEWGGMASPLLKNFLLMCNNQQTAHKPALLVAVSSGISGAYPIAELRMNALKNNKLVAVPDHLIIRNVEQVLNPEASTNRRDINLRERISYSLHMLHQYSLALANIRINHQSQPFPKQQEYAYGM